MRPFDTMSVRETRTLIAHVAVPASPRTRVARPSRRAADVSTLAPAQLSHLPPRELSCFNLTWALSTRALHNEVLVRSAANAGSHAEVFDARFDGCMPDGDSPSALRQRITAFINQVGLSAELHLRITLEPIPRSAGAMALSASLCGLFGEGSRDEAVRSLTLIPARRIEAVVTETHLCVDAPALTLVVRRSGGQSSLPSGSRDELLYARTAVLTSLLALPGGVYDAPALSLADAGNTPLE
jgi:hypothetical protein